MVRARGGCQSGAAAVEYVGIVIAVGLLVVVLAGVVPSVGEQVTCKVSQAIAGITGGSVSCSGASEAGGAEDGDDDVGEAALLPQVDPAPAVDLPEGLDQNHARYTVEGRSADIATLSRDDYAHGVIAEEVDGVVQQVRAMDEFCTGIVNRVVACDPGKTGSAHFEDEVKFYRTMESWFGPTVAEDFLTVAVEGQFYDGSLITSNTNQPYPEYYGDAWDLWHSRH